MSDTAAAGDCIFCRIVAGDLPADILDRSDHAVAFRDLNPQAPVHVLVIPRRHVENAATVEHDDGAVIADMVVLARRVAQDQGIAERGYRLVFNVGEDATNTVPHLHLHLLGGRSMTWPPG
ncbi:MAG TPA: histidine triad nucleotide-binding protein [Acidimicrobiales bacterium]|nr:histidine triad nucleotide-binding protein [Acidimicrobiales bacterium]